LRDADVRDKPPFANLAPQMADVLRDSVLAIQNAGFDVPMLNAEFERSGTPSLDDLRVTVIDEFVPIFGGIGLAA
jgi:DNA polymerase III epsilon subunit-like protein